MHSSELWKRVEEYGRLAQKTQSLPAKQRLLARQQKCVAMARAAEKREQAEQDSIAASLAKQGLAMTRAEPVKPPPAVPRPEPSALVKASPFLMKLWENGVLSPEELERRARDIETLKERFSATPFHAERATQDPDYWNKLYESRINW